MVGSKKCFREEKLFSVQTEGILGKGGRSFAGREPANSDLIVPGRKHLRRDGDGQGAASGCRASTPKLAAVRGFDSDCIVAGSGPGRENHFKPDRAGFGGQL